MKKPIEDILDICLEKVKEGIPLEEILKEYPDYRDELKDLLIIARNIRDIPLPEPPEGAMASCFLKMGEAVQLNKQIRQKGELARPLYFPSPVWVRVFLLAIIVVSIFWGTVSLSANSLPGSPLYPVKAITEKVKFLLTSNTRGKVELRIVYSEERIKELVRHLDKKRELNTELLKAMLSEASLALGEISRLPEQERQVYFSRLEYLNAYQRDVLENLKPKVTSPEQKLELENAIQMCGRRMGWRSRMDGSRTPPHKMGPRRGQR